MEKSPDTVVMNTILAQFTKNLQATTLLTQGLQSVQSEVARLSMSILTLIADYGHLRDKVMSLSALVQGEGMSDSLYKSLIQLDTRLASIEKYNTDSEEKRKEERHLSFPWQIALWTAVAAFFTMLANVLLSPIFNKFFK